MMGRSSALLYRKSNPLCEVGLLMGVTTGVGSLMNVFDPHWAGAVYDHVLVGGPYWMGTILLVLASLMPLRPAARGQQVV